MKNLFNFAFALMFSAFISIIAFAQDIPDADPAKVLMDLVVNWKVLGPVGIGSALIVFIVQLMKHPFLGSFFEKFKYKRVLILVLGQVYAVLFAVQSGSGVLSAVVGLFASGGAVAIWEALKPLLAKKEG